MEIQIVKTWKNALMNEFKEQYFIELFNTVREAYRVGTPVYPPQELIFNAFELCPFNTVKVVILGQDPYHGAGQAHGLCFSVQDGIKIPPSLKNIYKELYSDLGVPVQTTGDLSS